MLSAAPGNRTIIHIDQDAFFAACEMLERGIGRETPLAVGGRSRRGILTTANYKAREFGCRSAQPVYQALECCPHLLLVPPNFALYKEKSRRIREVFYRHADLVEPLSLDEAYLDVSGDPRGGASIAAEIRASIRRELRLPSSAGIAPNKLLAKIASDWNKPNGQFEIRPQEVESFMRELPVRRLWGVGPRTSATLERLGVRTCGQLMRFGLSDLVRRFGSFGAELYRLCRGIDDRPVRASRLRKSMSTENTFEYDIGTIEEALPRVTRLFRELREDLLRNRPGQGVKGLFAKVKFTDFSVTTVAGSGLPFEAASYHHLVRQGMARSDRPVRLLGVGVRFAPATEEADQLEFADLLPPPVPPDA